MKRPYQISAVVLLLFAAFIVRESFSLVYYTSIGPGPGFFPRWVGVLIGILAATMLYQATFKDSDPMPDDFFPSRGGVGRVGAMALSIVGVVVLMNPLGFRLTMLAFLLFLLVALGRQKPAITAVIALAGSFGAFYVFNDMLMVPLPVGMFGI